MINHLNTPKTLFAFFDTYGVRATAIARHLGVSNALVSMWRRGQRTLTFPHYRALIEYAFDTHDAWLAQHPNATMEEQITINTYLRDIIAERYTVASDICAGIAKVGQEIVRYTSRPPEAWTADDYHALTLNVQILNEYLGHARMCGLFPQSPLEEPLDSFLRDMERMQRESDVLKANIAELQQRLEDQNATSHENRPASSQLDHS
jgi:hypothetical protein